MRAREFSVMGQAVSDGIKLGWNRAHKHDGEPPDDAILQSIERKVLNNICEAFIFEDEIEDTPDAGG